MKFFIESVATRFGVVAGGVGRPEGVAVEQHGDVGAEDRRLALGRVPVAMQAVDDDVALAVVVSFPSAGELAQSFNLQPEISSRNHAIR